MPQGHQTLPGPQTPILFILQSLVSTFCWLAFNFMLGSHPVAYSISFSVKYFFIFQKNLVRDKNSINYQMANEATQFFQFISKHLQPQDFKKFQKLAQDGQKDLCWQILGNQFGKNKLKALQPMFDKFVKKKLYEMRQDSKRIPGHYLEAYGCQIYLYPRLTLSKEKMAQAESILVVGQTGAGKSTYLNALVNFLERVPADCNKRYALTEYNASNMGKGKSDTKSVRQYIIYNEKTMNKPLMVIDSPGFGDISGIQQDDKIPILIKNVLRNTPKLNLICFVIQSDTTKVNRILKYIIESVCSLFAKDVSPNFYFVLTFGDAHKPATWEILEQSEYSGKILDKIQGQKYVCLNNAALLKKLDPKSGLDMNFFKSGQDQLEVFMNKVHNTSPINMAQSIRVIDLREKVKNLRDSLQHQVDEQMTKAECLRKNRQALKNLEEELGILKPKQYVDCVEDKVEKVFLKPGIYTTYCTHCQTTCHDNCEYANGSDKAGCSSMENGSCKVCLGKCHWSKHVNQPYIVKITKHTVRRPVQVCLDSKNNQAKLIQRIQQQYQKVIDTLRTNFYQIKKCNEELQRLSMVQKKQKTIIEYLEMLVSLWQLEKDSSKVVQYKSMIAKCKAQEKAFQQISERFKQKNGQKEKDIPTPR